MIGPTVFPLCCETALHISSLLHQAVGTRVAKVSWDSRLRAKGKMHADARIQTYTGINYTGKLGTRSLALNP